MKRPLGGQEQAQTEEVERLRGALREREILLDLSANLAAGLLSQRDPVAAIEGALAELGNGTGVDRVYLFEMRDDAAGRRSLADQIFEWVGAGIEPQIDNPQLQGLALADIFPRFFAALAAGDGISGDIESFGAAERAVLDPQGILSILIVPVMLEGEFWGFLGFDSVRSKRIWSRVDMGVLKVVAATLGAAVQRRRAEDELRLAASVFEATRDAIVIADRDGNMISVNQAMLATSGYSRQEIIGQPWTLLVDADEAAHLVDTVERALRETDHWRGECSGRRKSGAAYPQWVSVNAITDARGQASRYVVVATDISQIKATEARLDFLAHHDALTDLPNRRRAQRVLQQAVERARHRGGRLATLFVDIDRFKGVNDSLGHPLGDELLMQAVQRLRARLRGEDLLARFGGDEFLVVLEGLNDGTQAMAVAQDLCQRMRDRFVLSSGEVFVAASIGICLYPDHAGDAESLVQRADVAMYAAKQAGRDQVRVYSDDMGASARDALALEGGIRRALDDGGLRLYYQPRIELATGAVTGAEALLRIDDGRGGLLPTAAAIALAERIGLIVPIGRWVLDEACHQARAWQAKGFPALPVAVNVSARQFYSDDLLNTVDEVLTETGVAPSTLEIELTESVLMDRPEDAGRVLRSLRDRGVGLALDDFGSGYSSLSYLMRFPVDRLKIDHEFVADLPHNPRAAAIAGAIVDLAHRLKLRVVAEGVETVEQKDFLRAQGVDDAQGYLFSAALAEQAFLAFLARPA